MLTTGSLCTGIKGAEVALELMGLEPDLRWYSEIDPDACKLLALRAPGVPNLGNLKEVAWERIEPVEALTAGYPCQPFSSAGKRGGVDDPRHLWPWIHCALRVLRPRFVFLENVAAHLSLGFDTVLADLAASGFDARWTTFRAAEVGGCHGRDRLFIVATDASRSGERSIAGVPRRNEAEHAGGGRRTVTSLSVMAKQSHVVGEMTNDLLPTPTARDGKGQSLPSRGGGLALPDVTKLLPTPGASGGGLARNETANRTNPDSQHHSGTTLADVAVLDTWGKYASAIGRWAAVMGRPAPSPTDSEGRLSPLLVEWMMGYAEGWVTDSGVSKTGQLRLLGNSIVPLQAATAWAHLLGLEVSIEERERELLPTPRTSDSNGAGKHGAGGLDLRTTVLTCL